MHQQGHWAAGGAFGGAAAPGRACDVQMRPWVFLGKTLQELGSCHRPGLPTCHIGHIGKAGFQTFSVFIVHRHAPAQVARVITGLLKLLRQLDSALWTFSAADFLPHSTAADSTEVQNASPILLSEDAGPCAGRQVLVNLGDEVPAGFERFERLIEIVAVDDHGRMTARQRWKHYTAQGYDLLQHDLSKRSAS